MAFWNAIPLVGDVLGMVGDELKARRKRHHAKLETELTMEQAKQKALLHQAESKQAHQIEWDTIMAKGSTSSWKDEWLTILFSIPLVACFIPGLDAWVVAGFEALERTPDWYVYALSVVVAASFGVRKVVGKLGRK